MKNATKSIAKRAPHKSKSKSKVSKKSQRIKDKETQKDLDSLLTSSNIFSDLQAVKPESKTLEKEKKAQQKKEVIKSANQDLLSQLESISNFSL